MPGLVARFSARHSARQPRCSATGIGRAEPERRKPPPQTTGASFRLASAAASATGIRRRPRRLARRGLVGDRLLLHVHLRLAHRIADSLRTLGDFFPHNDFLVRARAFCNDRFLVPLDDVDLALLGYRPGPRGGRGTGYRPVLDFDPLVAKRDLLLDRSFDHVGFDAIAPLRHPLADRKLFLDDRNHLFAFLDASPGGRLARRHALSRQHPVGFQLVVDVDWVAFLHYFERPLVKAVVHDPNGYRRPMLAQMRLVKAALALGDVASEQPSEEARPSRFARWPLGRGGGERLAKPHIGGRKSFRYQSIAHPFGIGKGLVESNKVMTLHPLLHHESLFNNSDGRRHDPSKPNKLFLSLFPTILSRLQKIYA